jgi:hypothetical protein
VVEREPVHAAGIAFVQQQVIGMKRGRIGHALIVPNAGSPAHIKTIVIPAFEPGSMTLTSWEVDLASSAG